MSESNEYRCPRCRADIKGVGFTVEMRAVRAYRGGVFAEGQTVFSEPDYPRCIMCGTKLPWTRDQLLAMVKPKAEAKAAA